MRKDIEAGKRTEIEQMNGAIARYAVDVGIPAPVNALISSLVRGMQNTY